MRGMLAEIRNEIPDHDMKALQALSVFILISSFLLFVISMVSPVALLMAHGAGSDYDRGAMEERIKVMEWKYGSPRDLPYHWIVEAIPGLSFATPFLQANMYIGISGTFAAAFLILNCYLMVLTIFDGATTDTDAPHLPEHLRQWIKFYYGILDKIVTVNIIGNFVGWIFSFLVAIPVIWAASSGSLLASIVGTGFMLILCMLPVLLFGYCHAIAMQYGYTKQG
jgi:hypothetical protein